MGQIGFLGEVRIFAGNFAPRGWALCNGQLMSIAQNSALFSILGTTYGGDGRTTFGLPDLRGRAPVAQGTGPGLSTYRLGQRSGIENVTLNQLEIPSHAHAIVGGVTISVNTEGATTNEGAGNTLGAGSNIYNSDAPEGGENINGVNSNVQLGLQGGNLSHENRMPFLTVHYIIATEGTYPSRS